MSKRTVFPTSGFSLIEIVIVLVLIGIMISLVVPSLSRYIDRNRTRRALDEVAADVMYARVLAIREGRPTQITFTSGSGVYQIRSDPAGTNQLVKQVNLANEYLGAQFPSGGMANLSFNSRGLLTGATSDQYLKVIRGNTRDSAFISPVGRVYRDY